MVGGQFGERWVVLAAGASCITALGYYMHKPCSLSQHGEAYHHEHADAVDCGNLVQAKLLQSSCRVQAPSFKSLWITAASASPSPQPERDSQSTAAKDRKDMVPSSRESGRPQLDDYEYDTTIRHHISAALSRVASRRW